MDEIWVRLGLIAGALVVAGLATWALRSRARGEPRRIEPTSLSAGVYLFTSATCADCGPARRKLVEALGESGFTEVAWEGEPGMFHALGIEAVPATMIVDTTGIGLLWPGQPDRALGAHGP